MVSSVDIQKHFDVNKLKPLKFLTERFYQTSDIIEILAKSKSGVKRAGQHTNIKRFAKVILDAISNPTHPRHNTN